MNDDDSYHCEYQAAPARRSRRHEQLDPEPCVCGGSWNGTPAGLKRHRRTKMHRDYVREFGEVR